MHLLHLYMKVSFDSLVSKWVQPFIFFLISEIPGLILSAAIVDRVGRKGSMAAMLFMSCISLLPLIFHQKEVLTTALLFAARICISASFTIVYIYAPEVSMKFLEHFFSDILLTVQI